MSSTIKESIFYHIYPLGFCDSPLENNCHTEYSFNLEKIHEWISNMVELGINAVYLGPLFESTSHGYDTIDYFKIDKRLGNCETLKNLINHMHYKNIKVVLDTVFNHVGRDFWAFKDVLTNKQNSKYCSWFKNLHCEGDNSYGDGFDYEGWNGHKNLVKLNVKNSEVENHLLEAVTFWIKEFNIDGLRIDAADCIEHSFLEKLNRRCKGIKNDFWLIGEIVLGDYRKWVNEKIFDSVIMNVLKVFTQVRMMKIILK